jgi:hypothetical protein
MRLRFRLLTKLCGNILMYGRGYWQYLEICDVIGDTIVSPTVYNEAEHPSHS